MLLLSIQNYFKFLKWIFKIVAKSCLFVPLFREFDTISISKLWITQFFKLKRCFEVDSIEWFFNNCNIHIEKNETICSKHYRETTTLFKTYPVNLNRVIPMK